jgi:hypothetical protein
MSVLSKATAVILLIAIWSGAAHGQGMDAALDERVTDLPLLGVITSASCS